MTAGPDRVPGQRSSATAVLGGRADGLCSDRPTYDIVALLTRKHLPIRPFLLEQLSHGLAAMDVRTRAFQIIVTIVKQLAGQLAQGGRWAR